MTDSEQPTQPDRPAPADPAQPALPVQPVQPAEQSAIPVQVAQPESSNISHTTPQDTPVAPAFFHAENQANAQPQPMVSQAQATGNAPYQQQPIPSVPPAPYGAPYGAAANANGTPYYAAGANGMPPTQPPYYTGAPYPYAPQPPKKKKVWPWVLGGCLLVLVLGFGGCAGCVAYNVITNGVFQDSSNDQGYNDPYGSNRGYGYGYGYGDNSGNGSGDSSGTQAQVYTRSEIESLVNSQYGISTSAPKNNRCVPGIYEVGKGKGIEPGLYYLEGSQTEESNYLIFNRMGTSDNYTLDDSVVYLGHYFAEFSEGDIVAFAGAEGTYMCPASDEPLGVSAPYENGVYRVGIDVPAGTYRVTALAGAGDEASQESAAYVMKDLYFNDDSILDTKYVIAGSMQFITVEDGQYVELFAAAMEPVE